MKITATKRKREWNIKFIIMVGPSGSGKSVVGAELAKRIDWDYVDTDDKISSEVGLDIVHIFEKHGQEYFRNLEEKAITEIFANMERRVIATGGGLPTIPGMMERLNNSGITIYLKASVEELWNRLAGNPGELSRRPLLRQAGRSGLEKMLMNREVIYNSCKHIIETDGMNKKSVVNNLISKGLAKYRKYET